MPILNYRTEVDANRTVAEIQKHLVRAGATRIMTDYVSGQPSALTFELEGRPFRLPCRYKAVLEAMKRDKAITRGKNDAQALRVAWRILKDWVEAQLALIEIGMVATDEVFLPYRIVNQAGDTVYDVYLRSDRALPVQ